MKPLCWAPFTGFHWKGNRSIDKSHVGSWRSCCESMSQKYAWTFKEQPTLDEIWNNPHAVEIRETLAKGEWHPNCETCRVKEEKFGFSGRSSYKEGVKWLDYRPSNLCNLKCRMCNGYHSSLLAAEIERHNHHQFDKKSETDFVVDLVDWSELERVKLLGGEPMIMEETYGVLEKVSTSCELVITTNAFNVPDKMFEALKNCKAKVQINLSIDGVGETYNYIRVNSNWNKVEENIKRLGEVTDRMSVNPVGMLWNCFNLKDIHNWVSETPHVELGKVHWVGEQWNRLGLLPDHLKEEIRHPWINHLLDEKVDRSLLENWKEETNRLDLLRGTNIVDLDERYVDIL